MLNASEEEKAEVELLLSTPNPENSSSTPVSVHKQNESKKLGSTKLSNICRDSTIIPADVVLGDTSTTYIDNHSKTADDPLIKKNCSDHTSFEIKLKNSILLSHERDNLSQFTLDDSSLTITPKMSIATTCSTLSESDFPETVYPSADESSKENESDLQNDVVES